MVGEGTRCLILPINPVKHEKKKKKKPPMGKTDAGAKLLMRPLRLMQDRGNANLFICFTIYAL